MRDFWPIFVWIKIPEMWFQRNGALAQFSVGIIENLYKIFLI